VRRAICLLAVLLTAGSLAACNQVGGDMKLTAYFPRTVSLYPHSSVRVLGLPAGRVTDVEVDGRRVRVEMALDENIPIPRDVRATLVPLSLIGERYIQLAPAWKEGQPRARSGDVLGLDRTSVPVEPDEALAAVKEFLDSLDPDATGRLVQNLAEDLEGSGANLNDALKGIADLTTTFAEKDDALIRIIEHFDDFTVTLRTREGQLGQVMDDFATTTSLLAQERRNVETLVASLADLSRVGFDLVSEHGARLDRDLTILTRLLKSVEANVDTVVSLLDSVPRLVAGDDLDGEGEGLIAAWDPAYAHLDLRTQISPVIASLFQAIGIPTLAICLPVDVSCVPGPVNPAGGATSVMGRSATGAPAAAARAAPARTPVDSIVEMLSSSAVGESAAASIPDLPEARRSGSWLARAARAVVEALA
jgi:virulence factor Mce-like protein